MLAPERMTVPVWVVGLLMVRAPLAPLKMPDRIKLYPPGALMVAAPLMVMGLLKVSVLRLANKVVEAAMVIGAEAAPSALA